jgi:guanylate kinase
MRGARPGARVFVVSSPSGGGKTTVVERLLRVLPRLVRSVSVTTRPPRPGEWRGRDYRFVTPAAFQRLRRAGRLLEWASVHGQWYGTPKDPVLRALARGRHVVLCIDVQGARQVRRALGARAVLVFLLPPSMRRLRARLLRRRTESPAALRRRLAAARREIACARRYDHAIVNDRLDRTVRTMHAILTGKLIARGTTRRPAGRTSQRKGQPAHGASAD